MKKIIFAYLIFVSIIFILPTVFTRKIDTNELKEKMANQKSQENSNDKNDNSSVSDKNSDISKEIKKDNSITEKYRKYEKIKLLHTSTNEIQEIPMEEYLKGVVSAEMPASFDEEALKAQAVVARTYTIYSIEHNNGKHEGADICDNSNCCQAWISKDDRLSEWEEAKREEYLSKIERAVSLTESQIILYNGEVIDAFFHSNSGGKTEVPVNVWGGTNYPYLQAVETAGESSYKQYSSEVDLTKEEFENKIKEKHQNFEINYNEDDAIKIIEYTDSGRVKTIKIGNLNLSGVEVRQILGLKSANFEVKIEENNIKFSVKGYGHGVGMSQTGADALAKSGESYVQIIKHFYTGVDIYKF